MTCISEQVLVHIGEGAKAAVEAMPIVGAEESGAAGDEQRVINGQLVWQHQQSHLCG